jgi:hypothetical protein
MNSYRYNWTLRTKPSDVEGVKHDVIITAQGRRKTSTLAITPWEGLELLRILRNNESLLLRLESIEDSTE